MDWKGNLGFQREARDRAHPYLGCARVRAPESAWKELQHAPGRQPLDEAYVQQAIGHSSLRREEEAAARRNTVRDGHKEQRSFVDYFRRQALQG
jgi:hypothetical protein